MSFAENMIETHEIELETHFFATHSPEEKAILEKLILDSPEAQRREMEKCARDPWYFLTGWGKTNDEHDLETPAKPFPAKEHLRLVAQRFLEKKLLIVYKSRQMMISWLLCGLCLWEVLFHPGARDMVQTKKDDDANALIRRAHFIYSNLPPFLRNLGAVNSQKKGAHIQGVLEVVWEKDFGRRKKEEARSEFRGIPEGADQVRSYTASRFWGDEFQLQDNGEEVLRAAWPSIVGGGKMVLTGTARPGLMSRLARENIAEVYPSPMRGIQERRSVDGYHVIELHYSADPDKDPATEKGRAWVAEAKAGPLGEDGWEREYEINDKITPGRKFFPEFDRNLHISEYSYDPQRPVLRGWDFGFHYPALVVGQFDESDRLWLLGSFRMENLVFDEFLTSALAWCKEQFPAMRYLDYIDPAGEQQTDRAIDSNAQVMRKHGLSPYSRKLGAKDGKCPEQRYSRVFRLLLKPRADNTAGLMFANNTEAREIIEVFAQRLVFDEKKEDYPAENHPDYDLWDAAKYMVYNSVNLSKLDLEPISGARMTQEEQRKLREKRAIAKFIRKQRWEGMFSL